MKQAPHPRGFLFLTEFHVSPITICYLNSVRLDKYCHNQPDIHCLLS